MRGVQWCERGSVHTQECEIIMHCMLPVAIVLLLSLKIARYFVAACFEWISVEIQQWVHPNFSLHKIK